MESKTSNENERSGFNKEDSFGKNVEQHYLTRTFLKQLLWFFWHQMCLKSTHILYYPEIKTNYFKLSVVLDYGLYMTGNGGQADARNYIETSRIAIFRSHIRKWVVFGARSEFNFNRSINWANTDVTFVLHRFRVVSVWVRCNRLGTVSISTGIKKHRDYRDLKDMLLTEKSLKIQTHFLKIYVHAK